MLKKRGNSCVFCVVGGRNVRSQSMYFASCFVRIPVSAIPGIGIISWDFTANSCMWLEEKVFQNGRNNGASQTCCGVVDKTRPLRKM